MSTHATDGQQPANIRPRLAAVPHPEEQGASARLRRFLNRVMRGRRISRRAAILSLVIEQLLIGGTRLASTTSYAENVIRSLGKAAGDRVLGKTQRILSSLAKKADGLRAQQADLRTHARYRDGEPRRPPRRRRADRRPDSQRPGQAARADRS